MYLKNLSYSPDQGEVWYAICQKNEPLPRVECLGNAQQVNMREVH